MIFWYLTETHNIKIRIVVDYHAYSLQNIILVNSFINSQTLGKYLIIYIWSCKRNKSYSIAHLNRSTINCLELPSPLAMAKSKRKGKVLSQNNGPSLWFNTNHDLPIDTTYTSPLHQPLTLVSIRGEICSSLTQSASKKSSFQKHTPPGQYGGKYSYLTQH